MGWTNWERTAQRAPFFFSRIRTGWERCQGSAWGWGVQDGWRVVTGSLGGTALLSRGAVAWETQEGAGVPVRASPRRSHSATPGTLYPRPPPHSLCIPMLSGIFSRPAWCPGPVSLLVLARVCAEHMALALLPRVPGLTKVVVTGAEHRVPGVRDVFLDAKCLRHICRTVEEVLAQDH